MGICRVYGTVGLAVRYEDHSPSQNILRLGKARCLKKVVGLHKPCLRVGILAVWDCPDQVIQDCIVLVPIVMHAVGELGRGQFSIVCHGFYKIPGISLRVLRIYGGQIILQNGVRFWAAVSIINIRIPDLIIIVIIIKAQFRTGSDRSRTLHVSRDICGRHIAAVPVAQNLSDHVAAGSGASPGEQGAQIIIGKAALRLGNVGIPGEGDDSDYRFPVFLPEHFYGLYQRSFGKCHFPAPP